MFYLSSAVRSWLGEMWDRNRGALGLPRLGCRGTISSDEVLHKQNPSTFFALCVPELPEGVQ